MKLCIQIPCFNEESQLPQTLRDLPRSLPGIDHIEFLVIDDGSVDRTAEVARALGAHVVSVPLHRGLANAFVVGIDACLSRGADVIVNTDGDNQYCGDDVAILLIPILEDGADLVIGARPIAEIESFSFVKKVLQRAGSFVVRMLSGTRVVDATSGFRAMNRETALQVNVFSRQLFRRRTMECASARYRSVSMLQAGNPVWLATIGTICGGAVVTCCVSLWSIGHSVASWCRHLHCSQLQQGLRCGLFTTFFRLTSAPAMFKASFLPPFFMG